MQETIKRSESTKIRQYKFDSKTNLECHVHYKDSCASSLGGFSFLCVKPYTFVMNSFHYKWNFHWWENTNGSFLQMEKWDITYLDHSLLREGDFTGFSKWIRSKSYKSYENPASHPDLNGMPFKKKKKKSSLYKLLVLRSVRTPSVSRPKNKTQGHKFYKALPLILNYSGENDYVIVLRQGQPTDLDWMNRPTMVSLIKLRCSRSLGEGLLFI